MIKWEIQKIVLEFKYSVQNKREQYGAFITRRDSNRPGAKIFNNYYRLFLITSGNRKYLIYDFILRGINIHSIKFKHSIVQKICSMNSIAVLNLKNEKNKYIVLLAQLKVKDFPKDEIILKRVENFTEPDLTFSHTHTDREKSI